MGLRQQRCPRRDVRRTEIVSAINKRLIAPAAPSSNAESTAPTPAERQKKHDEQENLFFQKWFLNYLMPSIKCSSMPSEYEAPDSAVPSQRRRVEFWASRSPRNGEPNLEWVLGSDVVKDESRKKGR
jgi:hypothetical protein